MSEMILSIFALQFRDITGSMCQGSWNETFSDFQEVIEMTSSTPKQKQSEWGFVYFLWSINFRIKWSQVKAWILKKTKTRFEAKRNSRVELHTVLWMDETDYDEKTKRDCWCDSLHIVELCNEQCCLSQHLNCESSSTNAPPYTVSWMWYIKGWAKSVHIECVEEFFEHLVQTSRIYVLLTAISMTQREVQKHPLLQFDQCWKWKFLKNPRFDHLRIGKTYCSNW